MSANEFKSILIKCGVSSNIASRVISEINLIEHILAVYSPVDVLCMGFDWSDSPEGYNYWKNVINNLSRRKTS